MTSTNPAPTPWALAPDEDFRSVLPKTWAIVPGFTPEESCNLLPAQFRAPAPGKWVRGCNVAEVPVTPVPSAPLSEVSEVSGPAPCPPTPAEDDDESPLALAASLERMGFASFHTLRRVIDQQKQQELVALRSEVRSLERQLALAKNATVSKCQK